MTILHSTDFFKAGISTVAIEPRLPQSAFPEHHHDFHEIVIVEQGSGIHVFNGQPYTIGGGSVCFIRDHDRHLYEHTDNLCLTNVLYRAPGVRLVAARYPPGARRHSSVTREESTYCRLKTRIMRRYPRLECEPWPV